MCLKNEYVYNLNVIRIFTDRMSVPVKKISTEFGGPWGPAHSWQLWITWFLTSSWLFSPASSHLKGAVWVFFQALTRRHTGVTCSFIQLSGDDLKKLRLIREGPNGSKSTDPKPKNFNDPVLKTATPSPTSPLRFLPALCFYTCLVVVLISFNLNYVLICKLICW